MRNYILKRLLLIPVTLLGILTINFAIVQLAPGGPVEYVLAKYRGMNVDAKSQFTASADMNMESSAAKYQACRKSWLRNLKNNSVLTNRCTNVF